MQKTIYILGAGTYGEVVFELATAVGYSVKGFFDDDVNKVGKSVMDVPVLGRLEDILKSDIKNHEFAVAIGNNKVRAAIMQRIIEQEGILPQLIHPRASVSPSATVGKGVYIHNGAYVWTKALIGDYSYISPNTVIAHHTHIGKACLISTLCAVGASIDIGDYCMLGIGTNVITGVKKIGSNVITGAGSVVIRDIPDNVVVVGAPARILRENG